MRLDNVQRLRRGEQGFSMVEAAIGMMVFGIAVLALTGGMISGFTTVRMARDNQRATQIILDKMELIRLYSWEQLNTLAFVPTTFTFVDVAPTGSTPSGPKAQPTGLTYTGRITLSDPDWLTNYRTRSKLVKVELTWTTGGIRRYRELTTLVTQDGLYSYVF
jgi:Tfp pilus assembly protein PilV